MNLRTAAAATGLALALCTGIAFAQSDSGYPPAPQQGIGGPPQAGPSQQVVHQGRRARINADVRAGRISKAEGKQLKQQLKAERAQRRAQKQARRNQGYQPANYPPSPPQPQQ